MRLISVVMPVFNAVKYIEDTLKSLLIQTHTDFELILINDGSTDGTYEICKRYAEQDERIALYSKENGGICSARNYGLDMASGRFITFCDHDDIYDKEYLKKAYAYMETSKADLLKFEYHSLGLTESGQVFMDETQRFEDNEFSLQELIENYDDFNQCIRVLWNGMYRSDLIKQHHLRFDESIKLGMEDYAFNLNYLKYCQKIQTVDECLYTHFTRKKQSAFTKFSIDKLRDIMKVGRQEIALLDKFPALQNTSFVHGMHNSIYVSVFLEQMTIEDDLLNMQQKVSFLRELQNSGALYCEKSMQNITSVYRYNWKLAIKLCMFDCKLYYLLILYQQINDKRKGK